MHPWIGVGEEDRRRILEELGAASIEELFGSIPEAVRADGLPLDGARDEHAVLAEMAAMAGRNVTLASRPSFLGAGAYRHVQPAAVDAVISRAELFTSYTPYQAEISQGTLQAIFEFQTLIAELAGLDVANASLYDGATALVEASLMAHRVLRGKRNTVVVAETVHPMYRRVLETYLDALGIHLVVVPPSEDGRTDPGRLAAAAGDACCVAVQSPSFLGIVEDLPAIAEAAHGAGALAVQVVAEAASLGLLAGGGSFGFDIVCGEAQSLGLPLAFGGPHLGFFACRDEHKRQMPGRLVGQTVDAEGRRAFCLTLSTREQHIRRAKATSNICSNHGLMALAATVFMELLGATGLRRMALASHSVAEEIKGRVRRMEGRWRLAYPTAPTFNEFLLLGPEPGEELARLAAAEGVLAGVPSRRWGGSWPDGLLVAATELNGAADIDALVEALGRIGR